MIADRHAYKHAQSHKQTRSSQLSALVFTLKVGELNRSGVCELELWTRAFQLEFTATELNATELT